MMLAYLPSMSRAENVFLIGPMGAGKSTIGRHLAELLGKEFQDSDHVIEARTGVSIPLIFEIEGEAGFRRRESAAIEELTGQRHVVLATGGGVVLAEENRRALSERGIVVYLYAPLETLVKRTQRDRNRPLLAGNDRRTKLEEIMAVREPLYRETADLVVNTGQRPAASVAREIVRKLNELGIDAHTQA
jgi:shikimate kinase